MEAMMNITCPLPSRLPLFFHSYLAVALQRLSLLVYPDLLRRLYFTLLDLASPEPPSGFQTVSPEGHFSFLSVGPR
ncbi:hypothetical protein VTL71DRAFT_1357 [Oculimacula yallundae]|uniref:Uncharacterized protein n=1 Tax=Oculimacula yallundae TaxID=86028 RepID=A0ABR4CAH0_9HELO